jgi:hypothetical protein
MGAEVMSDLVRVKNWRACFVAEIDRLKRTPFALGQP